MLTFNVGLLATLVGVHRNTVTNWIKKGKLPASPATAKRYAISKKAFIAFCKAEHIPKESMDRVLSDPSMAADVGADDLSAVPPPKIRERGHKPLEKSPEEKRKIPLSGMDNPVGAVMVVGGGIAGIQAALDLAEAGFRVCLVEKTAGIGGTMARLDKTFPTNDCASCIILPKLVECSRHLNIELMTLARVDAVTGSAGHFTVRVLKTPRYVDMDKCIACGICTEKCPVLVKDEFNLGINNRKAVYIKHDHSVPLKYAIDSGACIWFTRGKCRACETFCPTGAINFNQVEKTVDIHVGAVILAPGFKPFDPSGHNIYGYPYIKDSVTSLEFERLLSVSGPNNGVLLRPSDHTQPRKIAWLQCVGSRNHNNCGNAYCSNVCCMVSVKQSMASLEHISGTGLDRAVFFMDLRSHGKESERYFERAKADGVRFVRTFPHTLEPGMDGTGVRMRYVDETGAVVFESFDMAVLSIGFEASEDARQLSRQFEIELDSQSFARASCFEPVETSRKGIYVAGVFQAPASIPRSVVQASAAAASVTKLLAGQRHTLTRKKSYPREHDISGEAPSIGVFICSCGINIAGTVDVEQIKACAEKLAHVRYVENNLFSCSVDAQESIAGKIRTFKLNRIVIAACTPRTHEHMFQETLKSAGLNGFMLEMANIRNQNAWVHQQDTKGATQKAQDQVRMAVAKAVRNYPLGQESIRVEQTALVVGGGVAGMNAALTIADMGIHTILIEKDSVLGGNALNLDTCFKGDRVAPMLEGLVKRVQSNKQIRVHLNTTLESASGSVGNFTGRIDRGGAGEIIRFGAAVMTTGAVEAIPSEYGYGEDARVMTQMAFDRNVVFHPVEVDRIDGVVFIQCVGSREADRPYCSRICCIHSVKTAIFLKKRNPGIRVYILYREIRTYGEWEALYKEARELGVLFIRYTRQRKPLVTIQDENICVETFDPVAGRPVRILADYLSLASGVVARDNKYLADLFKFRVNSDGFFNGAHPKLKPVDLSVAGLFLAGLCNYPKSMDESIEESRAAALRAVFLLSSKTLQSEAVKAFVTEQCDGCALCVDVCPFQAISITDRIHPLNIRVQTDPALCQGCGICAATCPRDGIMVHGFTMGQLKAQVRAAVGKPRNRGGHDPVV